MKKDLIIPDLKGRISLAYRIFWHYGATRGEIIVVAIIPHPDE